ncbi:flagellar biosynthesis regulator FlaF [Jannaschia sp. M317]|uniref:flagellar biosynthesis regulator FlaF n=1 Tax=Jannaschia sp. M317 TaxID=2867011 RepID=UPI0021A87A2D|nr:flagellar biosynthesis regulator FlaF [Jannaschia sp. M317]UWQ18422.1 flagellar biosynthesis regulator FlhF [Jannaschia sp. M317]
MLNVHAAAAAAYGALDAQIVDPTRAEAMVFAKVTRRLEAIFADPASSHAARVGVLHDNRRLWLAAAAAVADDGNELTPQLRASLLGLSGFVERHTRAVLKGEAKADVLSEINRRVVGGLSHGAR